MKSRIIYTLLIVFTLSSCSDFLDVKPSGKLIPTEPEELGNLLNQTNIHDWFFLDNNIGCSYGFRGDNIVMSPAQQLSYRTNNSNMERYAAYTYFEPMIDFNTYYYYFWNWNYRSINVFNTVVDGIADLGPAVSEKAESKVIVSQARAARAFHYMVAAVLHGPMWDPAGDNTYKVMPYRTSSSPVQPNPQLSTTEELFGYIWEDLEAALANIPDLVNNPVKANKAAVHAMRAQFYMYKRDWDNMLTEADNAWKAGGGDAGKLIYNFNDFKYDVVGNPPTNGTDHEVTLTLRYAPGGVINTAEPINEARGRENLFWRRAATSTSNIYPSPDFIALFDAETDVRYKLFMLTNTGFKFDNDNDDGLQLNYLRASKLGRSHGITWPEVLLMRAEAYARTNNLTGALADLNTLRRNRYKRGADEPVTVTDHPDGAALIANQDRMLEEILKERRREMPFYSYHRAVDIKRYFHDTGKPWSQTSLTNMIGNQAYTTTLDKHALTLPITNEIIKYNTHWGLTPTEGYWNPGAQ